ncbi:MAG: hypothetical protein ABSC42_00595 [Tepidisphaeraceae bacterium]|jgi:hypothetical protein
MVEQSGPTKSLSTHRIEIKLRDINQLFNTMDASPFHEKDLDADAEEFIVSWAQEFPLHDPLVLAIHVSQEGALRTPDALVETAVHNYFSYRAGLSRLEFRRLMRDGRVSLLIGLVFLSLCLVIVGLLRGNGPQPIWQVPREGLIIAGWVAMWRPLQIYLYDWWPVRRRWKVFEKMGQMKIEIHRQGRSDET